MGRYDHGFFTFKLYSMKILSFLFIFLSSYLAQAQSIEGTIRYVRTSNWAKQMAATSYISKQQKERIAYMWGNRSEWKMYTYLNIKSSETKYNDPFESVDGDHDGYSWRKDKFMIFRNYEKNTIRDIIDQSGKTYLVEDSISAPNWKVMNDMKEVAGHLCMNAMIQDSLREQKIVAWFALDMPLSGGPERFCGLPGLILEVDINDGSLVISADKIDLKPLTNEMEYPKKVKGKKMTEAEYKAMNDKKIAEKRKEEQPWWWEVRY